MPNSIANEQILEHNRLKPNKNSFCKATLLLQIIIRKLACADMEETTLHMCSKTLQQMQVKEMGLRCLVLELS